MTDRRKFIERLATTIERPGMSLEGNRIWDEAIDEEAQALGLTFEASHPIITEHYGMNTRGSKYTKPKKRRR